MPRLLSTEEIKAARSRVHPEFHDDSCEMCALFSTVAGMVMLLDMKSDPSVNDPSIMHAYSDDEERDDGGRWTSGDVNNLNPISSGPKAESIMSFDEEGRPIGKSGKPLATISTDTSLSSLPEAKQKESVANLMTYGKITPTQAADHLAQIYDTIDPASRDGWAKWYQDAHDLAAGTGSGYGIKTGEKDSDKNPIIRPDSEVNASIKASGLSVQQMSAVIAALSPQSSWSSNMAGAYAVADIMAHPERTITEADAAKLNNYKNPDATTPFKNGMSYGDITGGKYDSPEHPGAMASVLAVGKYAGVSPGGSGYGKIEDAFAIAGGASIDDHLGGPKVRSFFNNINNSGGGTDVTIDSHMVEATVGGREEGSDKAMAVLRDPVNKTGEDKVQAWKDAGSKGPPPRYETVGGRIIKGSPSYAGATIAAYPVLADAVRNATSFVNDRDGTSWSPAEFQAMIWTQQLKDYPDGVSGR